MIQMSLHSFCCLSLECIAECDIPCLCLCLFVVCNADLANDEKTQLLNSHYADHYDDKVSC